LSLELNPTYFKALRARGQIFATLELYEPATEDFTHALEHGMQMMSAFEQCELKDELEEVKLERDKGKDYYKILGLSMSCPLL
jgi:DnaJ homolog subfamily C member 7